MLDLNNKDFLTTSEIRQRANSIFTETAAPTVSDKFTHIPTHKVIEDMMKSVQLDEQAAIEFATRALATRFPEEEIQRITIDAKELLKPTRPEDNGNDLWSIFNIVQEKLIEGNFTYNAGSKSRKARRIKNFQQDIKVNEKLFELALEFA